jgi:DNA-binding response OmpR family regulator
MAHARVLVVDSSADTTMSLVEALRLRGVEAAGAMSMSSALEIAERIRPQAVILDLDVAGGDVQTLCRTIRSRPWAVGTIFVALTGWQDLAHVVVALSCEFHHYLLKPASVDTIYRSLTRTQHFATGPETRW